MRAWGIWFPESERWYAVNGVLVWFPTRAVAQAQEMPKGGIVCEIGEDGLPKIEGKRHWGGGSDRFR